MKKILITFLFVLLLTGCSFIKFSKLDSIDLIEKILTNESSLINKNYNGYKVYIPRGIKVSKKNDYNLILMDEYNNTMYMYVDAVSYYYKTEIEKPNEKDTFISNEFNYNDKNGYVIVKLIDDKYYVQFLYNYSKIETYIEKENLNYCLSNISYILNSVSYNDIVLKTLIGTKSFNYKEEKIDIFNSKRESGNFLEYSNDYEDEEEEEETDNVLN